MGYKIKPHYKRKDGTLAWRIAFETEGTEKRRWRYIPKKEWKSIGFHSDLTMAEAKEIARKISLNVERKRLEEKRNKINKRLRDEDKIECEFLPPLLTEKFENDVLLRRFSDDDEEKLKASKLLSHWRAVKRIIRQVKLDPSDWSEQPEVIYGQFRKIKASPAYVQKLIRLMNFWGHFICKKQASAFLPLEFPRGHQRQKIATSYFKKREKGLASAPISPEELESASRIPKNKHKLAPELYNWLYISIWFGLRPNEIDQLKNKASYKITTVSGIRVLWVYQSKLTSLPEEQKWKLIPILHKEQDEALDMILLKQFKRPLVKTIKLHIKDGATTYGGRKGFHHLMSSKGYSIELISSWMGHKSVERTWRNYRNVLEVALPPKKNAA